MNEEVIRPSAACIQEAANFISSIATDNLCGVDLVQPQMGMGYWVSPLAILFSALIAALWAHKTIAAQRDMARKRATLDVLIKLESDAHYQKISAAFRDVRDGRGLVSLINTNSQREKEETLDVQGFLNHYELMCVGMKENTLDEAFLYQWFRGTFIHHWHDSRDYIQQVRDASHNKLIFKLYEEFATSWDNDKFVTLKGDPRSLQRK